MILLKSSKLDDSKSVFDEIFHEDCLEYETWLHILMILSMISLLYFLKFFFVNDVRKKAVFSSIIWTNLRYARLWDPRLWFQGFISRTCTKATLLREAWLLELVSFLIIFQFNLIALSASPVWFVWLLFLLQKSGSTTNKCLYL